MSTTNATPATSPTSHPDQSAAITGIMMAGASRRGCSSHKAASYDCAGSRCEKKQLCRLKLSIGQAIDDEPRAAHVAVSTKSANLVPPRRRQQRESGDYAKAEEQGQPVDAANADLAAAVRCLELTVGSYSISVESFGQTDIIGEGGPDFHRDQHANASTESIIPCVPSRHASRNTLTLVQFAPAWIGDLASFAFFA